MNKLILLKDIYQFVLILVVFTLPFSIQLNSLLIIILGLIWLTVLFIYKEFHIKNKSIFFLTLFLFLSILYGVFISDEKSIALFGLEKRLSIIIFPLILTILPKEFKINVRPILIVFIMAILIVILLAFRKGFTILFTTHGDGLPGIFHYNLLLIHRPYLGMYCAFCFISIIYLYIGENKLILRCIYLILALIFFAFIIVSYSKAALSALLLLTLLAAFYWLIARNKWALLGISASILLITSMLLYIKFDIHEKYLTKILNMQEFDRTSYDPGIFHSLSSRYGIWKCNLEVLQKENIWLEGVGIGDSQVFLNSCYKNTGLQINYHDYDKNFTFNAHSEYFQTWVSVGIFGLIILLFNLFYPFFRLRKNYLYGSFMLLIIVCFLTESMLAVQKGVVFYSLFNSLLAIHIKRA